MSKEKNIIANNLTRFWHPINIYNNLKNLYFSIIPKGSKAYSFTHAIINVFLKQLKFFNIYYREWIKRFDSPSEDDIEAIREQINLLGHKPTISVIMPVYNPPPELLEQAIQSVIDQVYPHWELCIADDASTNPSIPLMIQEYTQKEDRIKAVIREKNGHISAASNSALELASNEFIALLDHDDVLHPLALFFVAKEINEHPDSVIIYSYVYKNTKTATRLDPYFKPDFDYELLLSQNMVSHLGVYRTSSVRNVGGFRIGLEGSQDYDLVLRVLDNCKTNQIHHIPRPLYHWRIIKQSAARNLNTKPYAIDAATKALKDHLIRRSIDGQVEFLPELAGYHVTYTLPDPLPRTTILIPFRNISEDLFTQVKQILRNTTNSNFQVLIGLSENNDYDLSKIPHNLQEKVRIFQTEEGRKVPYPQLINQCISSTPSDFICILDKALTGFKPGWLNTLVSQASQHGIGAVGPKLINSRNNRVVSNGIVFLPGKSPQHLSKGEEKDLNGYFGWGKLTRGYSALSNKCMLFDRKHFIAVSGFTEALHDPFTCGVDFCFKLKELGLRNILRPLVELAIPKHAVSKNGVNTPLHPLNKDQAYLEKRWSHCFHNDPGFNSNLDIIDEKFLINLSRNNFISRKTI